MKTITLEMLAEKLNGKIWEKGSLKRVYLNEAGWNTKKMRTSAYIFEKNGKFIPVAEIECASQPESWIKSQKLEVIERLERMIEMVENWED
jgi:uncharacterized protein YkuJ